MAWEFDTTERMELRDGWDVELGLVNYLIVGFKASQSERVIVTGQIKWDGCADMQFRPDEADGNVGLGCLHWCGDDGFQVFVENMKAIKDKAYAMLET